MFTGLVQEIGEVVAVVRDDTGARLWIAAAVSAELAVGDSISVSGVCLTATDTGTSEPAPVPTPVPAGTAWFEAEAMNQTLGLTTLGALDAGDRVNLEPALRAGDRLGGHIVQGHVDGVGKVTGRETDGFAVRLQIEVPVGLRRYVAEHGSVTVSGVSLTVSELSPTGFGVSLIPETLERTTLGEAVPGSALNLEVDVLARYVERALAHPMPDVADIADIGESGGAGGSTQSAGKASRDNGGDAR